MTDPTPIVAVAQISAVLFIIVAFVERDTIARWWKRRKGGS